MIIDSFLYITYYMDIIMLIGKLNAFLKISYSTFNIANSKVAFSLANPSVNLLKKSFFPF